MLCFMIQLWKVSRRSSDEALMLREKYPMRKVAVFGNAGGGKSTLSKQLSEIAGLPLYVLDKLQYQPEGIEVPHED